MSNNPGGLTTPVSGAVVAWSLYSGGATVASASAMTWNAAGGSSASPSAISNGGSSSGVVVASSKAGVTTTSGLGTGGGSSSGSVVSPMAPAPAKGGARTLLGSSRIVAIRSYMSSVLGLLFILV